MTRSSASILVLAGALALGACNRSEQPSTPGGTSGTTSSSGAVSGATTSPGSTQSTPGTSGPTGADSGAGSGASSAGAAGASGGAAGSSAPGSSERDKSGTSAGTAGAGTMPATPSGGAGTAGSGSGTGSTGGTGTSGASGTSGTSGSGSSGGGSGGGGGQTADAPMLLAAGPEGSLRDAERKFLITAAQNGYAEIAASQLALDKAQDPQLKQFAQRMIDEHTAADKQLKELATSKGVNVPQGDPGKYKSDLDKLRGLSGHDFDRAYAERVGLKAHKDAVSLFDKTAKDARDPEIKAFAAKMAPTLHEHLSLGESMDKSTEMNSRAQRSTTTRGTGTAGSAGTVPPSGPGMGSESGARGTGSTGSTTR